MRKYEIVFVDIDDTLVPANEVVSEYTKNIMKKLKGKNIKVVINTGRSLNYAIKKAKEANLSEYVISSNGTEVYDYINKKVIFEKNILPSLVKDIYNYCNSLNMTIIFNSLTKRFTNDKDYMNNEEPAIYFENIDDIINNYKINQIIILSNNYERMLVIPNAFDELFSGIKIVQSSNDLINKNKLKDKLYYHDIIIDNTAKSTGIVELLDYLKIDSNKAMAIGNGLDDISMMDVVASSVAVANANPELKALTKYQTKSAKEDGVAYILEKLILESSD